MINCVRVKMSKRRCGGIMVSGNSIIIDDFGNLISIGFNIFKFLKTPYWSQYGIPKYILTKNDLMIFFIENSDMEVLGLDISLNTFPLLVIGYYENYDFMPLVTSFEAFQSFETIFDGNLIKINHTIDNLEISLSNSTYYFEFKSYNNFLCVFNNNVPVYLGHGRYTNTLDKTILTGSIVSNDSTTFKYDSVLQSTLVDAIKNNRGAIFFQNEYFSVDCLKYDMGKTEYFIISYIENCQEIDILTQRLNQIELIKSNNNTLFAGDWDFYIKFSQKFEKIAKKNATILLLGESGTGKSVLARELHHLSNRKNRPFIEVNCAAIPENLIESELFGYEEGAFTGARRGGKIGYFEMADHGILFLDEVGELSLNAQSRLLEVLQTQTFFRVGGTKKVNVNVRIIAATNRDLKKMVTEGSFRIDLFYRLNVVPIQIPPLRERLLEMKRMSLKMLSSICDRLEIQPLFLSNAAFEILVSHSWPGNLRELENVLEHAAIMCDDHVIQPEHLNINSFNLPLSKSLKDIVDQFERQIILDHLNANSWSKSKVAELLGIGRTTLFEKMKRYNLEEEND